MDCFHQTNEQKEFCTVLQNQRETTAEKQIRLQKTKVSYVSL